MSTYKSLPHLPFLHLCELLHAVLYVQVFCFQVFQRTRVPQLCFQKVTCLLFPFDGLDLREARQVDDVDAKLSLLGEESLLGVETHLHHVLLVLRQRVLEGGRGREKK